MTFDPTKNYDAPPIDFTVNKDKIVVFRVGNRENYAHLISYFDAPYSFGSMFTQMVLLNGPPLPYAPGTVIKVDHKYYGPVTEHDLDLGFIRLADSYKFDKEKIAIYSGDIWPGIEKFNMVSGGYVLDDRGVFKNIADQIVTIRDVNEEALKSFGFSQYSVQQIKNLIGVPLMFSIDETGHFNKHAIYVGPVTATGLADKTDFHAKQVVYSGTLLGTNERFNMLTGSAVVDDDGNFMNINGRPAVIDQVNDVLMQQLGYPKNVIQWAHDNIGVPYLHISDRNGLYKTLTKYVEPQPVQPVQPPQAAFKVSYVPLQPQVA